MYQPTRTMGEWWRGTKSKSIMTRDDQYMLNRTPENRGQWEDWAYWYDTKVQDDIYALEGVLKTIISTLSVDKDEDEEDARRREDLLKNDTEYARRLRQSLDYMLYDQPKNKREKAPDPHLIRYWSKQYTDLVDRFDRRKREREEEREKKTQEQIRQIQIEKIDKASLRKKQIERLAAAELKELEERGNDEDVDLFGRSSEQILKEIEWKKQNRYKMMKENQKKLYNIWGNRHQYGGLDNFRALDLNDAAYRGHTIDTYLNLLRVSAHNNRELRSYIEDDIIEPLKETIRDKKQTWEEAEGRKRRIPLEHRNFQDFYDADFQHFQNLQAIESDKNSLHILNAEIEELKKFYDEMQTIADYLIERSSQIDAWNPGGTPLAELGNINHRRKRQPGLWDGGKRTRRKRNVKRRKKTRNKINKKNKKKTVKKYCK